MEVFEKLLDKCIEIACRVPIFCLVFENLNKTYLKKYLKYIIVGEVLVETTSLLTKVPVSNFFFLCVSLSLISIGFASIYSERVRPLVLNEKNSFENTVYILYFFIYTGVAGLLLSGFILFG